MKKVYLYAFISIFLWSTVATVTKLLLGNLDSFQVLWISTFFAGIFLLAVNIVSGKIKFLREYKLKDYIITVLIGFPGTFLYYLFYYTGTDLMPASQAFIINYMWPIMCVLFACIILGETLTLRKIIAIAVSFAGVIIVTGGELLQFDHDTILGAVMCILGAVSYGIFTSLNQKMNYDKSVSLMVNYFVTFVLTSIINFFSGSLFIPSFVQTLGFMWNGMFAVATAGTVWLLALEKGSTAKISNLAYITPFLSLVWTSLILKEKIHLNSVLGLIVIVLGIFIQLKGKSDNRNTSVSEKHS